MKPNIYVEHLVNVKKILNGGNVMHALWMHVWKEKSRGH